ncbi:MAG: hypothetical protein IH571_00310 [Acholeplasmataceae bacterium]|nr:hypothetical protein [Acholeplasmataceae bacterium]
MKKFILIFSFFSIIFMILVFFFTTIQESNKRSLELFYEFAESSLESRDFEPFIKYQSLAYRELDFIETSTYDFYLYQVVALHDEKTINQFSIIVVPNTAVNYATSVNDAFDQTSIVIRNSGDASILYDSNADPSYENYAISYAIGKIGFYFYAEVFEANYELDIDLFDYSGLRILETEIFFEYEDDFEGDDTLLSPGFTKEEIKAMTDTRSTILAIVKNLGIYLAIDLGIGALLFLYFKNKKNRY